MNQNWRITSGATRLVLTLSVKGFGTVKKLQAAMADMRGVSSIQRRSFKKGVAIFDVNVKTGADNFANSLDGLKVGKRKKVEVTGIDGETISASVGR